MESFLNSNVKEDDRFIFNWGGMFFPPTDFFRSSVLQNLFTKLALEQIEEIGLRKFYLLPAWPEILFFIKSWPKEYLFKEKYHTPFFPTSKLNGRTLKNSILFPFKDNFFSFVCRKKRLDHVYMCLVTENYGYYSDLMQY